MKRSKILLTLSCLLATVCSCIAYCAKFISNESTMGSLTELYDSPSTDLTKFFLKTNQVYHIRYHHSSLDTIVIPDSCIISFEGGTLSAPVIFNHTRLSGQPNLKGSHISGSVCNEIFDASWICNRDGKTDDANNINQIISVSDNVFFPEGDYYLKGLATPSPNIPKSLLPAIKCHIGINKSGLSLFGEKDTRFISATPVVMICSYSAPNQINESISNVDFENITFVVKNDKENFYEFSHTIKLIGINNCIIKDCIFDDFWGDAITLSHYGDDLTTGERTRNQNIKILNNHISGESKNNRNAISVISGKNISIIHNVIENVSRSDMPGAIDIEANNAAYTVDGITIAYNKITGSNGMGGAINIVSLRNAPAHNIFIDHNTISNSTAGIGFSINSNDCVSNITVTSNIIENTIRPYIFVGNSKTKNWVIKQNISSFNNKKFGGSIKIENLYVD